ncbi:MAG: hypothetical protein H7068_02945, partial [Pedobacter sp.]|nr:hypothetical protein [Chitinophagaceae bacterium]
MAEEGAIVVAGVEVEVVAADLAASVVAIVVVVVPVAVGKIKIYENHLFILNILNYLYNMKKIIIASAIVLLTITANAQTSKIPVGKKLEMVTDSKGTMALNVMGQAIEIVTTTKFNVGAEVKSIVDNTITSTVTLKKSVVTINGMGQETTMDSDDKSTSNNPMAAEVLKNLNKPEDIIIENGKVKGKFEIGTAGVQTNGELAKQMFLLVEPANIKQGFKWTEDYTYDGSKFSIINIITKVTADEVEVTGTTNMKIEKTIQQMGMDMKQN